MTIQLLSVLSAAALAATGLGATSETRSAQSLPAQNLAVVQTPAASGKLQTVRHLADDSAEPSDETKCKRDLGHWDDKKLRCRRGGWWFGPGAQLLIGAGTVAGIIVAATESGPESNHNSVSH